MKNICIPILTICMALILVSCGAPGAASPSASPLPSVSLEPASPPANTALGGMNINDAAGTMRVTSPGIVGGVIDPKYGKNGTPTLSIPLEIKDAPQGTKAYAIYMNDPDAKPVAGFVFVHWMAVNIPDASIPEGYSQAAGDKIVQGKNDGGTIGYTGPAPPDKDHTYVIKVYALDGNVNLKNGFSKADFTRAVQGHVLAQAMLSGLYKK
jgi:Raf kinase inhibitor-like YbhB/YbcL family protein